MKLRRSFVVLPAIFLVVAGVLVHPSTRIPILRGIGYLLVAADSPVERVDVVVVAIDAGAAGLLEAADLVRSGVADRVATFVSPPGRVDLELIARGVEVQDLGAKYRQQLRALGVASVISMPRVAGTEDQGRVFPDWCDEHEFRSVLVVTSWDHSRRVQRVLERAMKGHPTVTVVRAAKYSEFSPDSWWQDRDGIRTVIVELQKLIFDFARHPFS